MGVGGGVIQYSISSCFSTFPLISSLENFDDLIIIAEAYNSQRNYLQTNMKIGVTDLYNIFHSDGITDIIHKKNKQVIFVQKHLEKTANTISFDEAIEGILKLRQLHVQMDEAVLDAYGWNDIELKHDFYEVDYLPENDRVRFTIHPDARKEVLKRLLELNHKIHEEEVKDGLWEKGKRRGRKEVKTTENVDIYYPGEQAKLFEQSRQGRLF
jgi:hypothetical protein